MRPSTLLALFPALSLASVINFGINATVSDCKHIPGDAGWPDDSVWMTELIGVEKQGPTGLLRMKHPQWRWEAQSTDDVIAGINFARKHNVRVSILNSGHDFDGRNDAPSGLTIVVRDLKGARVLPSFTATEKGVEPVTSRTKVNVLPKQAGQAYVTFGAGLNTKDLTNLLAPSKLFALGAAHKSVSVAGGWGQTAGHAPLSAKYGLGADQFVEFKVVTPDGVLRVANSVANPDLFWALRGGGGGTFGVVVEATVKVYPSPRVTAASFFLNATDYNDKKSIYPVAAYLHSKFPEFGDKGLTAYYYIYQNAISVFTAVSGDDYGTKSWVDTNWYPVLKKMSNMPGMNPLAIYISAEYPDYLSYFNSQYDNPLAMRSLLEKRHGPGDEAMSQSRGIISDYSDSWFLGKEHCKSPKLAAALEDGLSKMPNGQWRGQMVGGGIIPTLGNDTSVLPAWRKVYVHTIAGGSARPDASALRKLAPEMGAYANEASRYQKNWRKAFWGDNYDRLSEIKRKYDPEHLLWVTPGINAEVWEAKDGRLCRRANLEASNAIFATDALPPLSDNPNLIPWGHSDYEDWIGVKFPNAFLAPLTGAASAVSMNPLSWLSGIMPGMGKKPALL